MILRPSHHQQPQRIASRHPGHRDSTGTHMRVRPTVQLVHHMPRKCLLNQTLNLTPMQTTAFTRSMAVRSMPTVQGASATWNYKVAQTLMTKMKQQLLLSAGAREDRGIRLGQGQ
eukprot:778756-Pleurochrysis_carterae.AAC.2